MGATFKKRGNWYIDYYVNGKRIRKKIGKSKRVAELALADAELFAVKNSLGIAVKDKTLVQFFKEYRTYAETNLAPSTVKRYKAIIDHFNAFLEEHHRSVKKLSHLTPALIEKYKTYRKNVLVSKNGIVPKDAEKSSSVKKGAKPRTINMELRTLKTIFRLAMKWGYLRENPASEVKNLRAVSTKTPRFLSVKEVELVLANAVDEFKPVLQTFLYTGLRKAELVNLEWADVDFTRNIIHVRQKEHWKPKTTEREMPLHPALKKVLLALKRKAEGKLVFTTRQGNRLRKVRERFMALTKKCGFPDVTKIHSLRHTFASHLVMEGVPLPTVQKLMGHADIQTTMIYAHLSPDHIKEALEKLPF